MPSDQIKFKCTQYINNELKEVDAVTLPRTDFNVGVKVTSYRGITLGASHFYASLNISSLNCKIIGDESGKTFTGNQQPGETQHKRIDAIGIAPKNVYGEYLGRNSIEIRKGDSTTRFCSIEECIEAVESTFKNEFDHQWKLVEDCTDTTWEEYKAKLLEDYSTKKAKQCNTED